MTYKALYLSPMIPSFNLSETSGFFKDNLTIHILPAGQDIGQTTSMIYGIQSKTN